MIWIFNLERASAGVCDNYADVFQYIMGLEQQRQPANLSKPIEYLSVSRLESDAEKKQWCLDFCKSHQYIIIETPSQPTTSNQTQRNSPYHHLYGEHYIEQVN